jgi:uncharacterized protein YkwD
MSLRRLSAAGLLTAALAACAQPLPQAATAVPATAAAVSVEQLIIDRANRFRAEHGLPPVKPAPALTAAAEEFAQFMARNDKYGHEADGRTPVLRAEAHGYRYCLLAENIAYQYSSEGFRLDELARRFSTAWEESPAHRHNLLEPLAADTGVAVELSPSSGTYYAVQMFGREFGTCGHKAPGHPVSPNPAH